MTGKYTLDPEVCKYDGEEKKSHMATYCLQQ